MSSEIRDPALRRLLPWLLWGAAVAVAVPLSCRSSGLGVAPAMVEVRKVGLVGARTARLAELRVRPGDLVTAGQVLARLDPAEVEEAAEATLQGARESVAPTILGW